MHPRQVIAFAVILYRQLPIRRHLKREPAIVSAMVNRLLEFGPPLQKISMNFLKRRCVAGEVNEYHVAPNMRAHFGQPKRCLVDPGVRVLPRTADMGRRHKAARLGITPRMIGAADRAFDLARRIDQDHATVPTGVEKHPQRAVVIAQ